MPAQKKRTAKPKPTTKTAQATHPPVRRELLALLCLLLAIFAFIGIIGVKGIFLTWFAIAVKYLIGWGVFLLPCALIAAAIELFFHKKRPLKLRLTVILSTPLLLGILVHLLVVGERVPWSWSMFGELGQTGLKLQSAGVIGGFFATLFAFLLSRFFASLLMILALTAALLYLLRVSPSRIIDYIRREREPRAPKQPKPEREPTPAKRKLDLPPPIEPTPQAQPELDKPTKGQSPVIARELFNSVIPAKTKDAQIQPPTDDDELITQDDVLPSDDEPNALPFNIFDSQAVSPEISDESPLETARTEKAAPEADVLPATLGSDLDDALSGAVLAPPPYRYPPLSLLSTGKAIGAGDGKRELEQTATRLMETLDSFNIDCRITNVTRGPTVTRYELELSSGVRLSRLTALSNDIALALGAGGVRIAPVVNRMSTVGIEVPNKLVNTVYLREVLDSKEFSNMDSPTTFALGKDISGTNIISDIAKMPHLLIAGTTGAGKSVCMNSLIVSLLYKSAPDELRFIMIDPKMVEFDVYNGIPHLLVPVVTEPRKAAGALQWAVVEMNKRYRLFQERGVREINGYNNAIANEPDTPPMARIVIFIDEVADLMVVARKEVEESIIRIAQKARAAGMYLVVATQRPSADVITGLMKANLPSRIAFAVASQIESRIIMDTTGAEALIGRGDMLYSPLGANKPTRIQGCFIATEEVEDVVGFIKQNSAADYSEETIDEIERIAEKRESSSTVDFDEEEDDDPMLYEALRMAVNNGKLSTTMLQNKLKLGYARAARVVDELEARGFVGPLNGAKPREILISREEFEELMMRKEL